MSDYSYLMNTATVLYIVCYVPELYANYKNKNANFWNVPEKVVILAGSSFALTYSIAIEDRALMINYVPLFALDFIAFVMRVYYACKIHREPLLALPPLALPLPCIASPCIASPPSWVRA